MSQRCVDASIAVKWAVKGEPFRALARAFLQDSVKTGIELIAPPFFPFEVDTAICRRVFQGQMTLAQAQTSFAIVDAFPVFIKDPFQLRPRARDIADKYRQKTVYDSTYAALAEIMGCEFWTADKVFFDAVKGGLPFVKFLTDYP